jgi:hypothetical protein
MKMINWRSIERDGLPTDSKVGYLVSDGSNIEYSDLYLNYGLYFSNRPKNPISVEWIGGSSILVCEECSGTIFPFDVKFWCPVSELNLPETN